MPTSILSTSDFRLAQSYFAANLISANFVAFFNSAFVALLDKSKSKKSYMV